MTTTGTRETYRLITLVPTLGAEGIFVVPDVISMPRQEECRTMISWCLLNVNDNVIVKPALGTGGKGAGQSRFGLQAQHGRGVILALCLGEITPARH